MYQVSRSFPCLSGNERVSIPPIYIYIYKFPFRNNHV